MRKQFRSALAVGFIGFLALGGVSGCGGGTPPNPSPNPACLPAQGTLGDIEQALGIANVAWSVGKVFITNATIVLAINTALDSAQTAVTSAQGAIALGNCDIKTWVKTAADAIQVALADIAAGRPATLALAPSAGPDALSALIRAGNDKAEQAKAAVAK